MAEPPAPRSPARSVVAAPTVVVAFDFDGTLTRGGSVWPFLVHVCGWPTVARAAAVVLPRLVLAGLLGGHHADAAKEALFRRTLAGRPETEVEAAGAVFGPAHFRRRARPDVVARLQRHQAAGHPVAIVSASPELYLRPVTAELGVDALLATRLAVDGTGRLTGHYDGGNCRGPAKLRRVRQWAAAAGSAGGTAGRPGAAADPPPGAAPLSGTAPTGREPAGGGAAPVLWAYGNSAGDRELLAGADVGINVGRLGRLGRLRGFPSLVSAPDPPVAGTPPGDAGGA